MRLTYTKKSKSIRDNAMKQLRELRARFEKEHPELLNRIKEQVKNEPLYDDLHKTKMGQSQPEEEVRDQSDALVIDRKKNLMTVAALVQTQHGSENFQNELRKILLDVASKKS